MQLQAFKFHQIGPPSSHSQAFHHHHPSALFIFFKTAPSLFVSSLPRTRKPFKGEIEAFQARSKKIQFPRDHFLCEDEACLAKKFIVFQSEAEMKRHNAIQHGGRMSRAKRNAALCNVYCSRHYSFGNEFVNLGIEML